MAVLAARNHSEPSAVEFDNLIPYDRFLERRAWREKIADDFRRLEYGSVEIPPAVTPALAVAASPDLQNGTAEADRCSPLLRTDGDDLVARSSGRVRDRTR